jgi:hypothetical protein
MPRGPRGDAGAGPIRCSGPGSIDPEATQFEAGGTKGGTGPGRGIGAGTGSGAQAGAIRRATGTAACLTAESLGAGVGAGAATRAAWVVCAGADAGLGAPVGRGGVVTAGVAEGDGWADCATPLGIGDEGVAAGNTRGLLVEGGLSVEGSGAGLAGALTAAI